MIALQTCIKIVKKCIYQAVRVHPSVQAIQECQAVQVLPDLPLSRAGQIRGLPSGPAVQGYPLDRVRHLNPGDQADPRNEKNRYYLKNAFSGKQIYEIMYIKQTVRSIEI